MTTDDTKDSMWANATEEVYFDGPDEGYVQLSPEQRHIQFISSRISSSLWFVKNREEISPYYLDEIYQSWGTNRAMKPAWLFYDIDYVIDEAEIEKFITEINDTKLTSNDFTLLYLISLQEETIQKTLKALPLSLLYEIYNPIMEDNFQKWLGGDIEKVN
jgi:hypothetical protein